MLDRFKGFWQGVALAPFINLFIRLGISPDVVTFVERGSLPLTTSGKVRRQRCRELYVQGLLRQPGQPAPAVAPA